MRQTERFEGEIEEASAIQSMIELGSAYRGEELARGIVAYGAVVAMQSPAFIQGVRVYAVDPAQRREVLDRLEADPAYAATFPGAKEAAGLVIGAIGQSVERIEASAERIEADAYSIQERTDPRRGWAVRETQDRPGRLERSKQASSQPMAVSEADSAILLEQAHQARVLAEPGEGETLAA
ncbi:hypothetical protein LTR94_025671, partial [Friedmanniomyces endolithicus]